MASINNKIDNNRIYDCLVIGAGVIGSAIARELCRFDLAVGIVEKNSDVCEGTSKANSGIVHGGFDARPGTLKARMNVLGNRMMDKVCAELDVPFKRIGAKVLCFNEDEIAKLEELKERGEANGVSDLQLIYKDTGLEPAGQITGFEPVIQDSAVAALYCPSSGVIDPLELTLGFCENAVQNGAELWLGTEVLSIERGQLFCVKTSKGEFRARTIINAAGVYADKVHDMLLEHSYTITPRKGEYVLFDKELGGMVENTIFQPPGKFGKGVLVTPTVHGNLLIGPNANDIDDKEDLSTTRAGIEYVLEMAKKSIDEVPKDYITSFAGLRAHGDRGDFVLDMAADGFFEAACIESPGLSSAPAIGEYMAGMVAGYLGADIDPGFNPIRKKLVEEGSRVICRCENVTEGMVLGAIHSTIGATTLDGVKRRVRAGMGRCQGGFCSIKVMELLAREQGLDLSDVRKNSEKSVVVMGKTK